MIYTFTVRERENRIETRGEKPLINNNNNNSNNNYVRGFHAWRVLVERWRRR